jgi:uncharacterized protein YhbP (UPF0306 family)
MNLSEYQKVKNIIEENLYMTISVSSLSGEPWVANLFYAYDEEYNFYWYSQNNSTHSQKIRENSKVAISVFNSTKVGQEVDAVYLSAYALEVSEKKELKKVLSVYSGKLLQTGFVKNEKEKVDFELKVNDFLPDSEFRFYKASPIKIWKLGPSETIEGKYLDKRIEVNILELKKFYS